MSDQVTYLMPVESTNRELDYKVVLAAKLKAPHRQFVLFRPDLGPAMVRCTRGGVWVGQNIRNRSGGPDDYDRYRQMKSAGFAVVYVDEEGAIYPGDEDSWEKHLRTRLDPSVLADDDVLVGWGDFQRSVWSTVDNVRAQVVSSGHPRFDLCRRPLTGIYDEEVNAIRQKHGRFILLNSNFGVANHVGGLAAYFKRKEGYIPEDGPARVSFVNAWQRSLTGVGVLVATTHELAARFPSLNFVLRPHPAENHDLYRQLLAGVSNVSVNHEGPVVPWLRAASAIIHNGCTTAIESFLAGVTPIAYCPPSVVDGESWVPNSFSVRTEGLEELFAAVAALGGPSPPAVQRGTELQRRAQGLLKQLAGDTMDAAFAGVVEAIERVEPRVRAREPNFHSGTARIVAEAHGTGMRAKALARRVRVAGRKPLGSPTKFRPFTSASLDDLCRRVGVVTGKQLEVELLSPTACILR